MIIAVEDPAMTVLYLSNNWERLHSYERGDEVPGSRDPSTPFIRNLAHLFRTTQS